MHIRTKKSASNHHASHGMEHISLFSALHLSNTFARRITRLFLPFLPPFFLCVVMPEMSTFLHFPLLHHTLLTLVTRCGSFPFISSFCFFYSSFFHPVLTIFLLRIGVDRILSCGVWSMRNSQVLYVHTGFGVPFSSSFLFRFASLVGFVIGSWNTISIILNHLFRLSL